MPMQEASVITGSEEDLDRGTLGLDDSDTILILARSLRERAPFYGRLPEANRLNEAARCLEQASRHFIGRRGNSIWHRYRSRDWQFDSGVLLRVVRKLRRLSKQFGAEGAQFEIFKAAAALSDIVPAIAAYNRQNVMIVGSCGARYGS